MNSTNLIGRLTKDPQISVTADNKHVLSFTLAVNRNQTDADFIQVQAWEKRADVIGQYCKKGSKIGVTGKIRTKNYEDKDGKMVYSTYVLCDGIFLLDGKDHVEEGKKPPVSRPQEQDIHHDDISPFAWDEIDTPF